MPFIRINNRKNFLLDDVPDLHPSSAGYLTFWREQKKRVIEGFWGVDDERVNLDISVTHIEDSEGYNKWRWMPPQLYFYVNLTQIEMEDENSVASAPILTRPTLRDTEWEIFYNWIEARGFSGFEGDEDYTCLREVLDVELGIKTISDLSAKKYESAFKSPDKLKSYIKAGDYLRQLHTKNLGKPLYQNKAKDLMLLGSRGIGKLLKLDEPVRVKDGWKTMGDLVVGDKVYGGDGRLANITWKSDVQHNMKMFRITLRDGRYIDSCENHTWKVWNKCTGRYEEKSTKYLSDNYFNWRVDSKHKAKYGEYKSVKEPKYAIPVNKCISEDTEKKYLINSYVLGCILGDGCTRGKSVTLTSNDPELINRVNSLLPDGYTMTPHSKSISYGISRVNTSIPGFKSYIESLGFNDLKSEDKFIPKDYLLGSREQRLELLRGLLDTDGYTGGNSIEYCTVSKRLAEDTLSLIRSLGISCRLRSKETHYKKDGVKIHCKTAYRIYIYTDQPVFALERKLSAMNLNKGKQGLSKYEKTFITNIEPIEDASGACITVDNEDHTYITKDYIVTHNSYSVGNGVILHELVTDGKKRYDKEPRRVEIFVGAGIASKSTDLLEKVENAMNNLKGAWAYNTDNEIPSPLKKSMSGTLLPNNKRGWRAVYEKKVAGEMKEVGSRSTIKHGIYTIENPEAAAGTRPTVMIIEEVGLLEPVLKVHASNEACQTRNGSKFGSSFYIGTGGNVDKIQESEIIFRDPDAYGFLGFDDEWEGSSKKIGFFIPAYYANNEFKDHNGNTDVERAIAFYEKRRAEKRGARSSNALDMEMMNYPIKPSEMFLNSNKNMFPVADLKEQLSEIKTKPHKYEDLTWFGELVTGAEGKIVWKNKEASNLLREWPIKDNKNKPGVIQIFEMPKLDGEGKTMGNRYILGTDTYDDDESSTLSLGSVFVIDTFFDRIVAEFTGRPETTEFYEITRRLTLFYNAENNYEQNKKGLFWHYEKKNSVHLLAETPKSLSDTSDVKILKVGNRKYGTTATVAVNAYALRLINSWLVSPDPTAEEDSGRLNLHNIKSIGLLNELISYNPNGNFDRISALGMALILKEDKYQLYDHSPKETNKVKDLAQDSFFTSRFNKNALPNKDDGWLSTMNDFMQISHTNRRNNFPNH